MSVATVSRALNGYADVSEATRARVLAAAEALDYTPSAAARTLVTRRSHVVGVVLDTGPEHPDLQHPFFQEVLVGLKERIGAAGFDLLLFASDLPGNGFGEHDYLKRCRHHRVDGVVLMGVDPADHEVQALVGSRIPAVAVDLDLTGASTSFVMSDNVDGARLAVRHLLELGHRRVGTIAGPAVTRPGRDRLLGYRAQLDAAGIARNVAYEPDGDFYPETGYEAMTRLLALDSPPTAVFAASDLMAIGAIRAARERGVAVPRELSIVGFDDIQVAPLVQPALTTVRQDKRGLGAAAAELLVEMLEEPTARPRARSLPVELVVRESTGPAAAKPS